MEDKELLAAYDEITRLYGPQKRTFDEFKFQMQSEEYRKKVFEKVGDSQKDIFGYDNFNQFNADKFLPAPELKINDVPTTADNLPRFNPSSSTFVDQSTDVVRSNMTNPKTLGGGPGGNSRSISPRTQAIIDSNKEKKKKAEQQVALERAKKGAASASDLVTKGASFEDVVRNYSINSEENLLAGQLNYNEGKLTGIEKGQFEQKAINKISKDMFAVVDNTENSQVWKDYGDEYGFLINQLNSTSTQIKDLQKKIEVAKDPELVADLQDQINDLLDEGAEINLDKKAAGKKQLIYGSYNDMQDRFQQLNSLPEFKNYQRAINILHKLRDVSEDFENRNPEFVENQKKLEKTQEFIDMQDKYDLPVFTTQGPMPNFLVDGISKPILGALAKGLRELAALPRTLSFNNEYGWTDAFAEGAERMLSKEFSQNTLMSTGISSRKERGLFEEVARVDDYQLTLTDNYLGDKTKTPKSVRDADGFIVKDPKIVKSVIEKYEANPEDYKSEGQWNYESALPTFTGVVADLGILMFGTKGIGAGVKGTGALAKGTKVGNFLSKSSVANRIGLTAAVTGQTHNGLYEEAIRNGMSPAEASAFALSGSLVVAGIAQFNPQFYLIGEKKAASELTKRYIDFLAKGETKKQSFKFAMQEVFKQGGKEMFEELAEIPFLNATRYGFNQFLTPEKKFEIEWSRGEAVDAAIYGLAAGTGTGPMNITSQSALQQMATYSAYKAQDKFFKRTDDLVGKQYMDPESGDMLFYTKEQADVTKTRFKDLFDQMDKATEYTKELTPENETELLSLIQRSNNIQESMKGINYIPAVREKLDKENAKIQDAISNILDGNKKSIEEIVAESKTKKEADSKTETPPVITEQQVAEDKDFDNTFEDIFGARPEVSTEENIESEPKPEVEGDQKTETKEERYKDSQIPVSNQRFTVEDDNGNTIFVEITTNLDGSRKVIQKIEDGTIVGANSKIVSKDNTQTNEEYTTQAFGDIKQTEDVDIKNIRSSKVESKMSDRQRKAAGMDVAPNPNPKVKADQNTITNTNPKPIFTKEEVNTAKANNDYLTPLVEKLKKNFPWVEVVVDEKAIVDLAKSRKNVSDAAAKGAKGVFDFANNRVIINPKTATKDTPIHEFGHVWSSITKKQRPDLHKKGLELIKDSNVFKELKDRIANDPDQKKVYGEDTVENEANLLEEALAIAIGRRGAKLYDDSAKQSKWDKYVQEFFNYIKTKFGIDPKQAIEDLTLRDFIELASTEIITGQEIAPVESKAEPEVKVDENGQTLLFQANYIDPETGIEFTYDKNGEVFAQLVEDGFIDKSKKLSDFAGTNMILHSPDFAFSGQISKDGNVLIEGKGGMYYPIKFHDKGFFWASTSGAANSMVKLLNEALASSPDGKIRMALTTAPPTKVMSSTTAANGVVDLFTSDSFIKTLGLTEQRTKRSLVIAANTSKKIRIKVENPKTGKEEFKLKDVGLGMNLSNKMSLEEIKSEIRKKLGADNSTFNDRKLFSDEVFRSIANKLNKQNVNASKKLANFFKRQFPGMTSTGGKVSMSNLRSAVSYIIGEPILRNETESGKVYAVLEAEGPVKAVDSKDHESYPKAIQMVNKDSKVKLNILTDRKTWSESFEIDDQVNEDGSKKTLKQIYPSYGVTTTSLKVKGDPMFQLEGKNPVTEDQINQALQRAKDNGLDKAKVIDYLNRRFPDYTTERLSELYEGNTTPESDKPSANRKYTSRLAEVLSSETFEALSEDAKKYVPRSNQITDAEAQIMFDQLGVDESVKVIKQNPEYLLPEVRIALTNKVIVELESEVQKLRDEGKLAESETISAGINGIVEMMSKEGTRSGRFIQAFRMLNALSADRTIALIEKQLEQNGKNPLTEEEKNKLKDLIKTEKAAAEGLPKSKAVAELYKYKMSILGASGKDLFEAYFYGAILSGVTTQERNIVANWMSITSELLVTSVREAMKGNPQAMFYAPLGMIKGFAKGWLNAKNILKTGVRSARADKMDNPQLLEWWRWNTNSKGLNKALNSPWYTLNPWSPNVLKYVNRGMVAFDQMFYHAAKDMQAFALASKLKRGKNVTPEDLKKANDILNPPKEYIEDAVKEAKTEGFEEGTTEFKIRVHELVEAKRDLTIQGTAESFGSKTTFNYDPEGGLSYIYDGVVMLRNREKIGPIITTFIPFARVLTNVFNRFLHWTPVGFITATKSGKSGIKEFIPFSGLKFTTDSNGKKRLKNEASVRVTGGKVRALTSDEKSDLMIKATIGTSTMLGLYATLMKGLDEPDEDQWFKITAAGPTDYKKRYELQKGGWKPFTVSFGDVSFSYKDHPMFFIFVSAGTLYESNKYGNVIEDDLAAYVVGQTAMSMTGQSWLQGIEDLGGLMNREDWDKKVANKLFGTISSIVIPNFHKQKIRLMMDILDDPIKSRANGTFASAMSQLYRDIPMANSGLYDLVDSMGDPVIPNQSEKYIPFEFAIGDDADPIAKLLTNNGIFIGFPSNQRKTINFETGENRDMTSDEYMVYKIRAAKETGKALRRNLETLRNLSKTNQTEVMQDFVATLKKEARDAAFIDVFYSGGYEKYRKE